MTTIAFKFPTMAADTKVTDGDMYVANVKKIKLVKGHLIGACGNMDAMHWFLKNFDPAYLDGTKRLNLNTGNTKVEFNAIVVTPEGKLFDLSDALLFTPITAFGYYAIGSGSPYALGALYAGADAVTAVKAAMMHDAHTGGKITSVSIVGTKKRR